MTTQSVNYVTLDVFTDKRFKGNQVAVVELAEPLSTEQMQMIAREFNFSETVFLHRPDPSQPPQIWIFTPVNEMDFAGHPVIGTGHALFRQLLPNPSYSSESAPESLDIKIKAGTVTVKYDAERQIVSAQVPHNVHVHHVTAPKAAIFHTQPSLVGQAIADTFPAVSIVKGVTYVLVDFTESPSTFAQVKAGPSPVVPLDDDWAPSFVGTMYYRVLGTRDESGRKVWDLRVRMIAINLEDPACGSGSCSLAVYLALRDGKADGSYRFYLDQGSEIGRDSNIIVDVVLDESGKLVRSVLLSGKAAPVTEGKLLLP
ncbi:phenazine biosynthesis-like protein [Thelonectria olida]|uniref:Phenazine biosynthesis-like protein n=1 Tax=Thelonectria olida TaxID=1576542 RepID=A0A9P9AWN4_9HYPO|nr:phenazine biosynthesis-like protein [Thelonectria olida]